VNVVLVGDCGVDRYLSLGLDRAGGITLNVAAHMKRLVAPHDTVTVVTALGSDPESELVKEALAALGVETFVRELSGATSLQLIDLEPSGEKIFVSYHQGVLGEYRVSHDERGIIADADLLVAPHYRQIEGFFASVMASPSRGLRAVDFADVAENASTDAVERYAELLDVAFFGLTLAHGELIDALERVADREGKLFVVTLGPGGSLALGPEGRIDCPAAPVSKVVDTTGAGDTFAAAFLCEYCASKDVRRALRRGAEEAARTISQVGAF
jgi:fructoselysine 6-kinase